MLYSGVRCRQAVWQDSNVLSLNLPVYQIVRIASWLFTSVFIDRKQIGKSRIAVCIDKITAFVLAEVNRAKFVTKQIYCHRNENTSLISALIGQTI